eukprot:3059653-Pleurochrysis_carterae.AAC.1
MSPINPLTASPTYLPTYLPTLYPGSINPVHVARDSGPLTALSCFQLLADGLRLYHGHPPPSTLFLFLSASSSARTFAILILREHLPHHT